MDTQIGGKAKAGGNSSEDSKDKTQVAKSNVPFRARKGQVQVVKFSVVSRYDKQVLDEFDEYASNSISFEIGDMVWGKVKSHPWWPGHVFSEILASPEVKRSKIEGQVLVAFFGDSSYGWFYPADLLPFESHFSEKCRQKSSSRNFVKAVEEAVDEVTRRSGLGLECRCRNRENFRDSGVEGYFCVDVCGCEPGSVYSVDQIRKARDSFKPMEMVEFLNQLAVSPTGYEDQGVEFMKKKAAVVAYRKAVYQEVDETYDQAFGHIPEVRTSLRKTLAMGQSSKLPIRAPLSGPLVIAEALGKGKGFAKINKDKVQAKKEQYLFKRRANEFKSSVQIDPIPVTCSEQPVSIKGTSAKVKDGYVLQMRSPSVSTEHMVLEKQESTEMRAENHVSDANIVPSSEGIITEVKFAAVEVRTTGVQVESSKAESPSKSLVDQDPGKFSHPLEARPSLDKGKDAEMKSTASLVSNVNVGLTSQNSSKMIGEVPRAFESSGVNIDVKDDDLSLGASEDCDPTSSQTAKSELRDSFSASHVSETTNAELQSKDKKIRSDIGEKKLKIHKRTVGELNSVSSTGPESKRKKPKKELISSQNMQMHLTGGKNGSSVDNLAVKYFRNPVASRDSQVDPQEKVHNVNNSFFPNSVATQKTSRTENVELKLPQVLYNLKALALDPCHHSESSPTVIQQIVLKFRSIVFQKSLAPLPPTNSESKEIRRSKPVAAVASSNVSAENVRELKSENMQKLVVRPDDPAKGGRKRGPSDRQEEIAAKRKKIIDAKLLTDQKTAEKYSLMQHGEVKETSASTKKSVKPELVKKVEPPSRASDPTMLLLKFPLHGTLPSINELKARFIRFGQLDHSACRVFWKSLTCRVVFRHKVDAQAAYRYAAASNNMFGTTGVRCFLREMEAGANEQESGKGQRDEVSMRTSQLGDSTVEQRFPAALASQTVKQSGVQVKSILKRETADETSGNGGIRGTSRVKFMLGGEENSQGAEQLMIGNKNSTNAIFADGGTSTSHAIDFNSENFQNITPSPLLPLLPTTGAFQFPGPPQSNLQYTEEAPRTNHNLNIPTADLITPSTPYIDISEQMINLLTKCNDIVNNVTAFLGYVPYHPL
ncbi:PWWP domain-containing protein [Heracleum sosnowskyi]|uniref:PWWP domain-containing protein n=1 Tax=Heracleum sosnowskyi TaxID=360622 RepID=A0AAD8GPY9_9APIA|nr:PWWP domain-containing protein [Heracleum sosnowskyi]